MSTRRLAPAWRQNDCVAARTAAADVHESARGQLDGVGKEAEVASGPSVTARGDPVGAGRVAVRPHYGPAGTSIARLEDGRWAEPNHGIGSLAGVAA
jgi:hypothetical protein